MNALAEGVETEDQHRALLRMGCRSMQGFKFFKPMLESDLQRFILPGSTHIEPLQRAIEPAQ
jgi:EAL domain-containing protein (putative c-di-GMP-specific phosphodiesterase class I)